MPDRELLKLYDMLQDVVDRLDDEGDRVFLGSSNDLATIAYVAGRLEYLSGHHQRSAAQS